MTGATMKLVLVISSLSSGGAERVMTDMANYWTKKGWQVTLVTFSGSNTADFYQLEERVKRIHLGLRKPTAGLPDKLMFNVTRLHRLRSCIHSENPDAVISFMVSTNVLTILATYGMGLRTIVSERNAPSNPTVNRLWRFARLIAYRHAHVVVAQTKSIGDWIRNKCGARVCEIPNALRDLPIPAEDREQIILSIGSMTHQKGFDILLEAFGAVADRYPLWRLVILGDGPERSALEAHCAGLKLSSRVDMPGRVQNIEAWLARAGLVVQASRFEGFPNVVLEALGMGVPVISSDCASGPSEMIKDGVNGRLVPLDAGASGFATAIDELLSDNVLRLRMGKEAIKIRTEFSQARVMRLWEATLK